MRLRIKVDTRAVLKSFLKFPNEVSREVRTEMKTQMVGVQREARSHHRFVTRSGQAERSISTDVSHSGFSGRVFLDTGIAAYGPALHEGHGSWRPDRFLNAAMEKRKAMILKGLRGAVERAIKKAGF
jgi:hypothetical protein